MRELRMVMIYQIKFFSTIAWPDIILFNTTDSTKTNLPAILIYPICLIKLFAQIEFPGCINMIWG